MPIAAPKEVKGLRCLSCNRLLSPKERKEYRETQQAICNPCFLKGGSSIEKNPSILIPHNGGTARVSVPTHLAPSNKNHHKNKENDMATYLLAEDDEDDNEDYSDPSSTDDEDAETDPDADYKYGYTDATINDD